MAIFPVTNRQELNYAEQYAAGAAGQPQQEGPEA